MKKSICFIALIIMLVTITAIPIHATHIPPSEVVEVDITIYEENTNQITPKADLIEWHYKYDYGQVWKRRWNATWGFWVDPYWILMT